MFVYAHTRTNGQPVNQTEAGMCICGCHGAGEHPPAVEARRCQECADERFRDWYSFVKVVLHGD